ncbi:hypothetical protein CHS0354_023890 [Potamilus streckersoni]|uniref:16S rRNA (uracil(1498)-N(3))-methyltransferase n=1 Tax=Potamilus streckersoni TaxID=2493646 RepID=A0AAE0VMJ7_9BIVA|nr:hypothetical protein CHS0354_023890 [Potamilus streckersoni]
MVRATQYICNPCMESIDKFQTLDLARSAADWILQQNDDALLIDDVLAYYYFSPDSLTEKILYALKYGSLYSLGINMGKELAGFVKGDKIIQNCDALVPVPIHKFRYIERGYNQSEMIAVGFSSATQIPIKTNWLYRTVFSESQTKGDKSFAERKKNTEHVFSASTAVKDKKIGLIGDVFATGATVLSASRELKSKGAVDQMGLFFSTSLTNCNIQLYGDEFFHATHVLKHKLHDSIKITDGKGCIVEAIITKIEKNALSASVAYRFYIPPPKKIIACVAILKSLERYDFFLQKAVELGVTDIIPLITNRTIISIESGLKRMKRWENVILASCKQCEQPYLPLLHLPIEFHKLCSTLDGQVIFYYELATYYEKNILPNHDTTLIIGPEGGFTIEELEIATQMQFKVSGLGKEILRTETAALLAIASIKLKNLEANS